MKINDLYASRIENVKALAAGSLWQKEAQSVLGRVTRDYKNTDAFLQLAHDIQRLDKIQTAGLGGNAEFRSAFDAAQLKTWKDFGAPPVEQALQDELARKIYNLRPGQNDIGHIRLDDQSRKVGPWLVEKAAANNEKFIIQFADASFNALVLNHANEEGIKNIVAADAKTAETITRIMSVRSGVSAEKSIPVKKEKAQIYNRASSNSGSRTSSGDVFYTLTVIPTQKDAEVDGIEYKDYLKLFFEMCDQPWDSISTAQKSLIKEFNAASRVRITNNDGTDLSMSLVDKDGSHFTFCNSLIAKNVPGSEIFSAPRLDSVEGKVVAKGRFTENDRDIIENLTMHFKKGKLVKYSADKGLPAFEKAIGVDDGAKMVGELGIGTNPHLQKHVANGLLVEKIGGSFHIALGRPYSYTEYQGEKVKVDNGGKSALHWDITTMLVGKEGRIYLDDRLVMDNGKWLDKKYDVLNRGWEALPAAKRPAWAKGPKP